MSSPPCPIWPRHWPEGSETGHGSSIENKTGRNRGDAACLIESRDNGSDQLGNARIPFDDEIKRPSQTPSLTWLTE
jgi:hypothetical protein